MDAPHNHRTRSRAKHTVQVPAILNVPSTVKMQYALTLVTNQRGISGGKPHLVALQQGNHDDTLTQTLDLMPLRVIFSALNREMVPRLTPDIPVSHVRGHRIKIYIPEMLVAMGLKCNMGDASRASLLRKLNAYRSLAGVIANRKLPVITGLGINDDDNTLIVKSEYLNEIILNAFKDAIRKNKDGKPQLDAKGMCITKPYLSDLMMTSLASARNKTAAEIVYHLVLGIQQVREDQVYGIRASSLIARVPQLQHKITSDLATREKNIALKRAFTSAWDYLDRHTLLGQRYPGFRVPDIIPTVDSLDAVVRFFHDGNRSNQ